MPGDVSRFEAVSRRRLLKGSLAAGALALIPVASCGNKAKPSLGDVTTPPSTPSQPSNAASTAGSPAPATSSRPAGAASGPALPASAKLAINFSFAAVAGNNGPGPGGGQTPPPSGGQGPGGGPGGGGQGPGRGGVRNPFVAVWIEDSAGHLLKPVSLWYLSRESRYLQDLTRWSTASSSTTAAGTKASIDTVSGATRAAGTYSVVWDGTDIAGTRVAQGQYFVCIEAAREHGPYELVRQAITIGAQPFKSTLAANGELTAADVDFAV